MSFIIVSGLSGSGKSIALKALEDIGYYCIDNLPAGLLPHFARQFVEAQATPNAAVSIDARNRGFLQSLPDNLDALSQQGIECRILFLESDEASLMSRFKETRRKHPLTDDVTPLLDGIRLEKQLLSPLSIRADTHIDTTHTTPHELRAMVVNFASSQETTGLTVLFESFGYKNGTPLDADFVFDVRCLPNPYWQPELRNLTGLDEPVARFLESDARVGAMFDQLRAFLETWLPGFEAEQRSYMTIALGCTGGQHRSVYLAQRLATHFTERGVKIQIRHRELA